MKITLDPGDCVLCFTVSCVSLCPVHGLDDNEALLDFAKLIFCVFI